ncbi:mechanosensitive ion channel family protein [Methanobrevibacter sp.]|uniref:mechanosensitive ion channel family protein n=1 Tax=Methanobrevibacter sp. TaxID=66852 RepID=UPI0025DE91CB|nr:mechanosensitive ion channel domain-containing protein [Methanobrevibacter sp.]MBQ6512614.1 mechanosensitive ion channel [Methanobrevibacter sp.]
MNILPIGNPAMILIYILIIILLTTLITRFIAYLMNRMDRTHENQTIIYLIRDIINYIIYFIAIMIILQLFGINLAGTLLSLGIVGIAVSFAAKDIISNLFSGMILILGKSIKVGDTIEVNGKKGYVERISLRSTVLVDDLGVRNHVPNSTLTNDYYLQFKQPEKYRVDIQIGLPLNIDVEKFSEKIIEKISSYPDLAKNPKPQVFSNEIKFEESRLKVSFWVKNLNDKDKYKLKVTNDIRKYMEQGENNE